MLRSYIAAALRNLLRSRAYAAINLLCLALGFAAAMLIALYVRDEYSYDRFFPDHARIFKIDEILTFPGRPSLFASQTTSDMAQMLGLDFPAIDMTARLVSASVILRRGTIKEPVAPAYWADPNFFRLFPLKAIDGALVDALTRPDSIVLTRKVAQRFFGRVNVVGESIELNGEQILHVAAVIEDLPSNTHLTGDVFLPGISSSSELAHLDAVKWESGNIKSFSVYTYVRLRPGARVESVNAAMPNFISRHLQHEVEGVSLSKALTLSLSPVAGAHLQQRQVDAMKPQGDRRMLQILMGIAVLIVIVAVSNFVSMMSARAVHRAIEVGVRKAVGATRLQIFIQFIGESLLYAGFAVVVAIVAVELIMPGFKGFLQRDIRFTWFSDPLFAAGLGTVALVSSLAAGVYPSLVLARFRPASVLKGLSVSPSGPGLARQAMVIFQFATMVALIIVTMTVWSQARFAIDNRLHLPNDEIYLGKGGCPDVVAVAVQQLPGVRTASCASAVALAQSHWGATVLSEKGEPISVESAMIDYHYFDLFGIKPIAGRLLTRGRGEDDALHAGDDVSGNPSVVINESAARALGFNTPKAAVGQSRRWTRPQIVNGAPRMSDGASSPIVGVVPDFSIGSVRDVIEPTMYYVDPTLSGFSLVVRFKGQSIPETLRAIKDIWLRQGQSEPFEGVFLSQYVESLYSDIARQGTLFSAFSTVAIAIGALGLLGLTVFTVERRTKEMGLRKVFGASRFDILRFLAWQFARPVLWANLLAWPSAYFLLRRWLEGFAYHVEQRVLFFLLAGAVALVIALATVSGQALVVARAKPVEALRYE
jgi:putative ABC transport system permease protein